MLKKKQYGLGGVMALVMAGGFVCSPVFADGPVDIKIVEKVEDGSGGYKDWEDITGAMPGMSYSAIPRVKNGGEVLVGVRMCLSESAVNASGEAVSLPAGTFRINIGEKWVLDNEGATDTSDPASGNCYKYNSKLEVGNVTDPVFTEVTLSPALRNEYQGATFTLHLDASAIGDYDPVTPDEPSNVTPSNPDTGGSTASKSLTTVGTVFLSLGAVILVAMTAYWLKNLLHKK